MFFKLHSTFQSEQILPELCSGRFWKTPEMKVTSLLFSVACNVACDKEPPCPSSPCSVSHHCPDKAMDPLHCCSLLWLRSLLPLCQPKSLPVLCCLIHFLERKPLLSHVESAPQSRGHSILCPAMFHSPLAIILSNTVLPYRDGQISALFSKTNNSD